MHNRLQFCKRGTLVLVSLSGGRGEGVFCGDMVLVRVNDGLQRQLGLPVTKVVGAVVGIVSCPIFGLSLPWIEVAAVASLQSAPVRTFSIRAVSRAS